MRTAKEGGTLNSRVHEALRSDILSGVLMPGQKLKVASLAATHDVSLNVIREALNRLAGEQLVEIEPQLGFTVRQLSAADLDDLVSQRVLLESIALRECIRLSCVEWQSEVLAAHHRLHRTPSLVQAPGDEAQALMTVNPQWLSRHDDFHRVLLQACGSKRLFQIIRQMAEAAEMYHRVLLPGVSRDEDMDREHQQMVDAILAGDADAAVRVLVLHLEKGRNAMLPLALELEARTSATRRKPALAGLELAEAVDD